MRPYVLLETNWKAVKQANYELAVLPWGATEAHNYHLPYGTDVIEAERIAIECARLATARGARVVVLPTIPFGVQTGQLDIELCINMNPSTQAAVLADVVHSLEVQGIHKLMIINSHGGNDFRQMIRELQPQTDVFLCSANWWQVGEARDYFTDLGDHAGELETSVMLALAPELVLPLGEAGVGAERKSVVRGLRERWVWAPRPWTQVSADTGIGNPARATAEKGRAYLDEVVERLSSFMVDIASADVTAMYDEDGS
ncbi:MAG: creatininase family protein [Gemmatimonadaceae bacterium]|nr:creatininase family protein [Gemmatimonadaceae bacterium]